MGRIDDVYHCLSIMCSRHNASAVRGVTSDAVAEEMGVSRCNVSSYLNKLCEQKLISKIPGRPVRFFPNADQWDTTPFSSENIRMINTVAGYPKDDAFGHLIGADSSMKNEIDKAKAAIMYPPKGLPTLITGETGCGKSLLAKLMYQYAVQNNVLSPGAQFVVFNCANYASNPQLIMAQLFGHKKGAFTGANENTDGLVDRANGGILFLDEIHRFPPEAQEMLFYLMDNGSYHRLGEVNSTKSADVLLVFATTEKPQSALLSTFLRRIPVVINVPSLQDRSRLERKKFIEFFFSKEAQLLKYPLTIHHMVVGALMSYDCPGNIGQLVSDIKMICARAYMNCLSQGKKKVTITLNELPLYIKEGLIKATDGHGELSFENIEIKPSRDHDGEMQHILGDDLYSILENQYHKYSKETTNGMEIVQRLDNDISLYFNKQFSKYITDKKLCQIQLMNVVSTEILEILEQATEIIKENLDHVATRETMVVLALHISAAIERVSKTKREAVHQKFEYLKQTSPNEYETAAQIVKVTEQIANIKMDEDEIGYITKLILAATNHPKDRKEKVGILVAAYGNGCARTMAEVANLMLKTDAVNWYDVNLEEPNDKSIAAVTDIVCRMNCKKGIVLLVDMGTLSVYGDFIARKTGIQIKTIDNVTTSMVIQAAQLADDSDNTLENIYASLLRLNDADQRPANVSKQTPRDGLKTILAVCITGEGTAMRLKSIIEQRFELNNLAEVVPLDFLTLDQIDRNLNDMAKVKDIVCIVGIHQPQQLEIPFVSVDELMFGTGFARLENILKNCGVDVKTTGSNNPMLTQNVDAKMLGEVLSTYLYYLDGKKMVPLVSGGYGTNTVDVSDKAERASVYLYLSASMLHDRAPDL